MTLASARRPDLRYEKITVSSCPGSLPSIAGERTAVSLSRDRVHFSCRHAGRRPERNYEAQRIGLTESASILCFS